MTVGRRPLSAAAAWAVLAAASLGVLLGGAELMVVAIALPAIVDDFGGWADLARASWIINGYLLAYIVAMPLAGRAADLWGANRLYLVALALFAVGSAGAGLARFAEPSSALGWLIAARVVQGLGGGALVPLSMALASHLFAGRARAAALGVEGAATFVGMAIGPAYGAWVLSSFNLPIPRLELVAWQWIFFLNVPVALLVLLVIYVVAGGVETPRVRARLDVGGAVLLSVGLLALVGALTLAGSRLAWTDPLLLGGLALAALALAGFVLLELRLRAPLIDPRLLADRQFGAANALSLLTGYTLATAIVGGPVFVSRVAGGGVAESGMALTALTAAIAAGAVLGGLLAHWLGYRTTSLIGVVASSVALLLLRGWSTETEAPTMVRDLALFGLGFGLTISPRATAAVEAAGASAYGVASAMLTITRTVGMSVGLAILTSIGQGRIDELTELVNDPARRDALVVALGEPRFVGADPRTSAPLVELLEGWSQAQAAEVLSLVFSVALVVSVAALLPALLLAGRRGRGARALEPREVAVTG